MEENRNDVEMVEENEVAVDEISIGETLEPTILESLEQEKSRFVKKYKNSRYLSIGSTVLVLAIIIVSYTTILDKGVIGQWIAIILIALSLIGSLVFSRILRNKVTNYVKDYMRDYNGEINNIALETSEIQNYYYDFKGMLTTDTFVEAKLLEDVNNTTSRNYISYDVKDSHVEVADYVAYRQNGKKAQVVFLGKLFKAERRAKIDGRILIHIKPDKTLSPQETVGPDDLGDLVLIEETPTHFVYATSADVFKKLKPKALGKLLKLTPSKDLADITISMYENKVIAALSFSDAVMVVPYKEPVAAAGILEFQKTLQTLNEFLTL